MPPERTCVVTRETGSPADFVRIVVGPEGEAGVDYRGKLKGRGAWLTPTRQVVEDAERKPGILRRALECPTLATDGLLSRVQEANLRVVLDLLSLSARAGALVGGADAIGRLLPESVIGFLTANDAAPASLENAQRQLVGVASFEIPLGREALGLRVGKGPRAVIALRPAAPTRALLSELRRMQALR